MIKKVFLFSLPLILANLVVALGGFVAMWVLARLGYAGVAAGALVYNTFTIMAAIVFASSVPVSILTARAYGARRYGDISSILHAGCWIVIGVSIPVIITLLQVDKIYAFFQQPVAAATMAAAYFKGYVFALIPFSLRLVLFQLLNGMSKTKLSLVFAVMELILGAPLACWFSQGGLGLAPMGATGVALSTACTSVLSLSATLLYLRKNCQFIQINLLQSPSMAWIKRMLSMAIPISAQRVGEVTAFFAITVIIGHMGQIALASYEIPLQFSFLSIMICFGLTQAAGILVGQALGEGKPEIAKQQGLTVIGIALIIALGFSTAFLFAPQLLIHVFVDEHRQYAKQITTLATAMLSVTSISLVFDVVRNVTTGALRGYQDTRYPMFLALISCWVIGVPLGYAFSNLFHWGPTGATAGFAIGVALGCIFSLLRLFKRQRLTARADLTSTQQP